MRQRIGRRGAQTLRAGLRWGRRRLARPEVKGRLFLWPLAAALGTVVGYLVIGFRLAILGLEELFYGASDAMIHSAAARLPWHQVLLIPMLGGLAVGLVLRLLLPDPRPRGVDAVIEGAAIHGGRIDLRTAFASVLAALITLSTGGSTGREGPAIQLGAAVASWVSERLRASGMTARDILGCGAAAAVAASFNAPLAGAIFALEVVLRHYALHAFAPVVLASVAGAIVSRVHLGNVTEFTLPAHSLGFYGELPAFALLGIVAGLVAIAMIRGLFLAEAVADRVQAALRLPEWLRPAVAGLLLGLIALRFPHIIGVGYETTSRALTAQLGLSTAIVFAAVKVIAVAVTYAGRMGGGVFSPSVMVGALAGLAFGKVATALFPEVAGAEGLYALAGTGAVAAAVLGAPVSSILIVIELTGDWQAGIAVMVSVSLAAAVADRLHSRSFFIALLERRGLRLGDGPQGYIARTIPVAHLMRYSGAEDGAPESASWELVEQGVALERDDTLERALAIFDRLPVDFIPVIERRGDDGPPEILGALFRTDALRAYARALEEELREEHA